MSAGRQVRPLPAAERRAVPWKNGGGVTRELAVFPEGADFTTFQWRISLADIHVAGPFSVFEGIERHLVVIHGSVSLQIGAQPAQMLGADSEVICFGGAEAVSATPAAGGATDLNVMVRRGQWRATLTRRHWGADAVLKLPDSLCFLVALQDFTVSMDGGEWLLGALDALRIGPADGGGAQPSMHLQARPAGRCLLIELQPAGGAPRT